MKCTACDQEKEHLIQLPVHVKTTDGTFTRDGIDTTGNPAHICFLCLEFEIEETL